VLFDLIVDNCLVADAKVFRLRRPNEADNTKGTWGARCPGGIATQIEIKPK